MADPALSPEIPKLCENVTVHCVAVPLLHEISLHVHRKDKHNTEILTINYKRLNIDAFTLCTLTMHLCRKKSFTVWPAAQQEMRRGLVSEV